MDIRDEKYKKLILQAEIAALLHDIGKFTKEFLEAGTGKGDPTKAHTVDFIKNYKHLSKIIFETDLPSFWLSHPKKDTKLLKTIIDFINLHHAKKISFFKEYYQSKELEDFLLLNYLLIMGDIIDSSSSKGGASFKQRGRNLRLNRSHLKQNRENIFIATPFGEKLFEIDFIKLKENQEQFVKKLDSLLVKLYQAEKLNSLIEGREELLKLFNNYCRLILAETRLPTNDISLFHHSYATASIFKAMLARHLLLNEYEAWDENKNLAQYKEHLAYLGICWDEDELLAKSYRPTEIIGRRKILDDAVNRLKDFIETDLCLGNEIYRDRNGIYFLIPSLQENFDFQKSITQLICNFVEEVLNSQETFWGDLNWRVLRRDIGVSVLELAKLLFNEKGNIELSTGPRKPLWMQLWQDQSKQKEVCPRCGLRPKEAMIVSVGSEQDRSRRCGQCRHIAHLGGMLRNLLKYPDYRLTQQMQRLFGIRKEDAFFTFDFDELLKNENISEEKGRIALISAFFNLEPFISGDAFSNILIACPEDFTKAPGKEDKSYDFSDWSTMLEVVNKSWNNIFRGTLDESSLHTLQQVLQDSFYGDERDGRIEGKSRLDKARNFITDYLLKTPFSHHLKDEAAKIINYSLRLHPAPSRLSSIWDSTRNFLNRILTLGESYKIPYIPLVIDSGSVMFLMRADEKLWQCCLDIYNEYCNHFARVRHLLPFHLCVTVFYHKSPLYVAIDAARRFRRVAMEEIGEKLWKVKEDVRREGENYILELEDHRQRDVIWKIPALLPNGREDRFYT
ncbi:hypothetical protein, partial [Caminibacter sp.]